MRRFKTAKERAKEKRQAAAAENRRRYAERIKEVIYYIDHSDLSLMQISRSTGVGSEWLKKLYYKKMVFPNDDRVQRIIDFCKHFEQLQSYYIAKTRTTEQKAS